MFLFLQEIIQYVLQQIRRFKKWKRLKKGGVRRKVFLFCALRSTLQFTFFFLNILGKSLIFALDDIGEIDFGGRK